MSDEVISEEKEVPGADDWTEVKEEDGEIYEFTEEGDSLEGTYESIQENIGENNSRLYSIKLEDESVAKIWGTFVLDSRMAKVPIGSKIKIQYNGKKESKKSGRQYHDFSVFVK